MRGDPALARAVGESVGARTREKYSREQMVARYLSSTVNSGARRERRRVTGFIAALLAVLAYTYLGYPVVIGLLARLRRWRPAPTHSAVSVGDGLPAGLQRRRLLPAKIASLLEQDYPGPIEILLYCDGCSDDSEPVARALAADAGGRRPVRVIVNPDRAESRPGSTRCGPRRPASCCC